MSILSALLAFLFWGWGPLPPFGDSALITGKTTIVQHPDMIPILDAADATMTGTGGGSNGLTFPVSGTVGRFFTHGVIRLHGSIVFAKETGEPLTFERLELNLFDHKAYATVDDQQRIPIWNIEFPSVPEPQHLTPGMNLAIPTPDMELVWTQPAANEFNRWADSDEEIEGDETVFALARSELEVLRR